MPQIQILPLSPQQQQPSYGSMLGQQLGGALGQGISGALQDYLSRKSNLQLQNQLQQAGIPAELSELFPKVSTGGQTAIVQKGLEMGERGLRQPSMIQDEENDFRPPLDEGLTLKEKAKREEQRYGKNIEALEEADQKYKSLQKENLALEQLQTLNKSGELPSGLGRINVDLSSGELRLPFLASPEAQLFIKTINDFTTKAKDSYGARVTNFELDRFMQRLPSLLNSEQGRELIISQMKTINELDQLYANSLINAFEKSGGARKIDLDQARSFSNRMAKERGQELISSYKDVDSKLDQIAKRNSGDSKLKKAKSGEKISEEMARDILKKANNDPKKAAEIARKLGYEF